MSARQTGKVPSATTTAQAVPTSTRATGAQRGNAAAQAGVKAAQAPPTPEGTDQQGGIRSWLQGVGQAAVDTTSQAMETVGNAWSAVKTAGQQVNSVIDDSGFGSEDGVVTAHTDLDTVAPLLPASWGAALGKGPADPAANRVGVSMDTNKDRLTLSIPDLRLSGMAVGGYHVASLAVSGVVLTLDNAGGVARTIAAQRLGGGLLGGMVAPPSTVGAVRLSVAHLVATGVKGPGGAVGRVEAEGLDATVGSDGDGKGADTPLGVSGAFRLRSLTVGGLDAGGARADAVSASAIRLDGDADTGAATLAVGAAGVKNLELGGARVGSGSVKQLTASADLNGASRTSRRWSEVVDPARAEGTAALATASVSGVAAGGVNVRSANVSDGRVDRSPGGVSRHLGAAHVTGASLPGGAVGELDAKGVDVAHLTTGDRVSVDAALATNIAAGSTRVGRAMVTDAALSSTGARKDAHVGYAEVGNVSAAGGSAGAATLRDGDASVTDTPGGTRGTVSVGAATGRDVEVAGASLGNARVSDVDGAWSGATGSGTVGDVSVDALKFHNQNTKVDAASVSGTGLSGSRGANGLGGRADELAAQGLRVDHTAPSGGASTRTQAAAIAAGPSAPAGPAVRLNSVELAGLVKDADVHATAPLGARTYGGDVLGATVEPGTQATANVSVRDGKIVPSGTNVKLNKGVDLPAWVDGDGAYLTNGPGGTGRVNAALGGAPDVDVTKYIPGVEGGVPLGVSDLARRYTTPVAPGSAASSPTGPANAATTPASTPAPVDVSRLSGQGSVSLEGGFDVGVASGVLAGERAGDNRVSGSARDGGKNVAVEFIRLLVGSLRVHTRQADVSARKVSASSGHVSVDAAGATSVRGEIGALKVEGAEAQVR